MARRRSWSIATRNAARVLPEPVGAEIRVVSPIWMLGQPCSCGSVAEPNLVRNHSCTTGCAQARASVGRGSSAKAAAMRYCSATPSCFVRSAGGLSSLRGKVGDRAPFAGTLLRPAGWGFMLEPPFDRGVFPPISAESSANWRFGSMRDRRISVLGGSVCIVAIAAVVSFPSVCLLAQQASKSGPGAGVPQSTQTMLTQLQTVLAIAEATGDAMREAAALIGIGEQYLVTGDSQTALENFTRALPIVRRLGLKPGEAMVLLDMGGACREASKELQALEYDNEALALFRELGNREGESNALNNLGIVYYDLGENQKSLEFYSQALAMYEKRGDKASQSMALN